jgi:hypothetical protein
MRRVLGGEPLSVVVRLIVLSIVVGVVMAVFGFSPLALLDAVRIAVLRVYNMGFDAFGWLLRYFLLGAVVVVPIWLIGRFWSLLKSGRGGP